MSEVMARQLAQLLASSDLDELKEVVAAWTRTAGDERSRRQYADLGARLLELKAALAQAPTPPTREELELALGMMMKLAAERGGR